MIFDPNKYRYVTFTDENGVPTVVAISTYAGRTVKGKAKLDPRDEFNMEKGKEIAAARCNARVAEKRARRARLRLEEAEKQLKAASRHYEKMRSYYVDSHNALEEASKNVQEVLWD